MSCNSVAITENHFGAAKSEENESPTADSNIVIFTDSESTQVLRVDLPIETTGANLRLNAASTARVFVSDGNGGLRLFSEASSASTSVEASAPTDKWSIVSFGEHVAFVPPLNPNLVSAERKFPVLTNGATTVSAEVCRKMLAQAKPGELIAVIDYAAVVSAASILYDSTAETNTTLTSGHLDELAARLKTANDEVVRDFTALGVDPHSLLDQAISAMVEHQASGKGSTFEPRAIEQRIKTKLPTEGAKEKYSTLARVVDGMLVTIDSLTLLQKRFATNAIVHEVSKTADGATIPNDQLKAAVEQQLAAGTATSVSAITANVVSTNFNTGSSNLPPPEPTTTSVIPTTTLPSPPTSDTDTTTTTVTDTDTTTTTVADTDTNTTSVTDTTTTTSTTIVYPEPTLTTTTIPPKTPGPPTTTTLPTQVNATRVMAPESESSYFLIAAIAPKNANIIFAKTITGTVYRSADAGLTWAIQCRIANYLGFEQPMMSFVISPTSDATAYVVTWGSLFRVEDQYENDSLTMVLLAQPIGAGVKHSVKA
jgi:hypothetical protein